MMEMKGLPPDDILEVTIEITFRNQQGRICFLKMIIILF
jgi:hypothetical protein